MTTTRRQFLENEIRKLQSELAAIKESEHQAAMAEAALKFTHHTKLTVECENGIDTFNETWDIFHNGLDLPKEFAMEHELSPFNLFDLEEEGECIVIIS